MSSNNELPIPSLEAQEVCKRAIFHVLGQIRDRSEIGWYMGHCTESFDLLTQAAALIKDESKDEIIKCYEPRDPRDPRSGLAQDGRDDQDETDRPGFNLAHDIPSMMTEEDVIDYLEGCCISDRIDVMRRMKQRFCGRCGGDNGAWGGQCGCHTSLHFNRPKKSV